MRNRTMRARIGVNTAATLLLGLSLNAALSSSAEANGFFSFLQNHPQTIAAVAYENAAEVEAGIKARNVENRSNPPVYDPVLNAARWDMSTGISSADQIREYFPKVSSGNLVIDLGRALGCRFRR